MTNDTQIHQSNKPPKTIWDQMLLHFIWLYASLQPKISVVSDVLDRDQPLKVGY